MIWIKKSNGKKMMNNKKGWIKIAEAFIAIILIAAVMLTVYAGNARTRTREDIIKIADNLLDEIVQNEGYRKAIVVGNYADSIKKRITEEIPAYLDFEIKICEVDDVCPLDNYVSEVYARERIVSSTWSQYSPKKLKLFLWEK